MIEIVIATRNPFKMEEIARILAGLPVKLRSIADVLDAPEVEENGETFEENATAKARAAAAITGWALADDSGLEVDALGGEPGIRSARWAGVEGPGADEANNARLVEKLRDVPAEQRTGRYVCVVALAQPGQPIETFRGTVEGRLVIEPKGRGGFGYDPYFYYAPFGRTFGEASADEKDSVSHRGAALEKMRAEFEATLRDKL